jgi:hypothetical protein
MHRLVAVVLLAGAVALAVPSTAGAADPQFTLTANFVGLYPNANVTVPVTVHNPLDDDLAVHTASVRVGDASPACSSANLQAESFTGDVLVRAGSDGTIPLRMHMPATAPDGCQGARFPLIFTASATPASATGAAGSGGFAFTGAETGTLAVIGAGACALGLVLTRRRTRSVTA